MHDAINYVRGADGGGSRWPGGAQLRLASAQGDSSIGEFVQVRERDFAGRLGIGGYQLCFTTAYTTRSATSITISPIRAQRR